MKIELTLLTDIEYLGIKKGDLFIFVWTHRTTIATPPFNDACLYQSRKVSGHAFVWCEYHLCLLVRFSYSFLVLFRRCCTLCFWYCSDGVVLYVLGTVPTVLYFMFLVLFRRCCTLCSWYCSDGVVLYDFHFIRSIHKTLRLIETLMVITAYS